MTKKIIIIGKVSDQEKDYSSRFEHAEKYLSSKGFSPVNYLEEINGMKNERQANVRTYKIIEQCDAVFLLPDWTECEKAKQNVRMAIYMKMKLINGFIL